MGILEVSYYYPNFISLFDHFSIGNRDINVLGSLHLELIHGLPCLGNIQLVAVLHNVFSSFPFLSRFFLRSHSITAKSGEMSVILRKRWGRMEIGTKNFQNRKIGQMRRKSESSPGILI